MKPAALKFQRDLALRHVARMRADASRPLPDQRIAAAVAPMVGAAPEDVLKWMKGTA